MTTYLPAPCALSTGISRTTKAQYTEPVKNYVADEDITPVYFCQQKSNRKRAKNEQRFTNPGDYLSFIFQAT